MGPHQKAAFEVADPSTVVVEMAGGAAGATGAVAPGTRVKTYMGPGTVQRTKKDGVTCVIELEWALANDGKATLFCREDVFEVC